MCVFTSGFSGAGNSGSASDNDGEKVPRSVIGRVRALGDYAAGDDSELSFLDMSSSTLNDAWPEN